MWWENLLFSLWNGLTVWVVLLVHILWRLAGVPVLRHSPQRKLVRRWLLARRRFPSPRRGGGESSTACAYPNG